VPAFDTPEPISVSVDLPSGDLRVIASDRPDTVVDVVPGTTLSKADVLVAQQTLVEFADGRLQVRAPRQSGLFGRTGAVRVTIALPAGSHVQVDAASADFRSEGRLGECTIKTASGDVRFAETGPLRVDTASGDITVGRSAGEVSVTVQSGDVRIDEVDGAAVVRGVSGDIRIGAVTGDLRINSANGDISVDRALGDVVVKISSGDIRIGEVVRGSTLVEAASGDLEIGVRAGTAAWLDVGSRSGSVRNLLTESDGPGESDETVEVRAHAVSGDITIRRSRVAEPSR
jgi:DUF4097 and DUF4098 domain-containing protein YvlB